jgi:hypothetical protein
MERDRVTAIKEWPFPTSVQGVQIFSALQTFIAAS